MLGAATCGKRRGDLGFIVTGEAERSSGEGGSASQAVGELAHGGGRSRVEARHGNRLRQLIAQLSEARLRLALLLVRRGKLAPRGAELVAGVAPLAAQAGQLHLALLGGGAQALDLALVVGDPLPQPVPLGAELLDLARLLVELGA